MSDVLRVSSIESAWRLAIDPLSGSRFRCPIAATGPKRIANIRRAPAAIHPATIGAPSGEGVAGSLTAAQRSRDFHRSGRRILNGIDPGDRRWRNPAGIAMRRIGPSTTIQ